MSKAKPPYAIKRFSTVCQSVWPGTIPHQHGNSQPPLVLSISCTRTCLSFAVSVGAGVEVGGAEVNVGDAVTVGGTGLGVGVYVGVGDKGVILADGMIVGNAVLDIAVGATEAVQLTRNISAINTPTMY